MKGRGNLEHEEIRSICNDNGSALPLPLGEGWGEGLRSLVVRRPLTRFALDDASHRQEQIDLSPLGRGEANPLTDRFNQKASRFSSAVIAPIASNEGGAAVCSVGRAPLFGLVSSS